MRPAEARTLLRTSIRDNDKGERFSPARLLLVHNLRQFSGADPQTIQHQVLMLHAGSPAAWLWAIDRLSGAKVKA